MQIVHCHPLDMRFKVLTVISVELTLFWDVMPCSFLALYNIPWWWWMPQFPLKHIYIYVKVKVKWSHYRPSVARRVGRGIALLFHNHGTRRGSVVSSTPRPHFTTGKDLVPILQKAGWAPGLVWTGGKSRPHRHSIRTIQPIVNRYTNWATRPTHTHTHTHTHAHIYIYVCVCVCVCVCVYVYIYIYHKMWHHMSDDGNFQSHLTPFMWQFLLTCHF